MNRLNQLSSIGGESPSILSRLKKNVNTTTIIIFFSVILFSVIAGLYYYYKIYPSNSVMYKPNKELINSSNSNNTSGNVAELLFFYVDWCPYCKTALPVWNNLKSEYENKTIGGYSIMFTEINCTKESADVEQMVSKYNIEGYPTIKLLKNGQVIEYDAKPTEETLNVFLNTFLANEQ
jgi:thiol-disulfide isomerase/thioredoxin